MDTLLGNVLSHPLKDYVLNQVKELYEKIKSLETTGAELDIDDIRHLSSFFFKTGMGIYVGVESNLPSTYFELYPDFLRDNQNYLKTLSASEHEGTKRILIARSGGEIRTDAIMHPQPYKNFIEWHRKNKVGLYWIEEDEANRISDELETETTDVAFWSGSYAITFQPNKPKNTIRIKMVRNNTQAFTKAQRYIQTVSKSAHLLTLDIDKLPVFSQNVVKRWDGYIGGTEFRENGLGKLLLNELNPNNGWKPGRVLDAAAGSGYETLLLSKYGMDVTANEIDPAWNTILKERTKAAGVPVEIYQYDWRKLSDSLQPLYTAVVAVGNSLCMVIGKSQRERSIKEFYKVLKPNGKLIIDERNFDSIIKRLQAGKDCYSKGSMYACSDMNAKLSIEDKTDRLIRFNFFDNKTKRVMGSTVVQAPKKNELMTTLKRAGFKNIKVFSDFQEGHKDQADFFTYVATK